VRRIVLALAVAAVVGAVAWSVLHRPAEWTTANPQALAELQLGVEALEKVYLADARRRFEKVLDLDPGCVAARIFLIEVLDGPENRAKRNEILEQLRTTDLGPLTARERFMVRYLLALVDNHRDEADAMLDAFVASYPKDPFALRLRANRSFSLGRLDEAQREYERLLEVAPNYVVAYNQLGYTAMARGQFAEAERMLRKYRFIAPDQANPHDSLGELLLLLGRYPEAEQEFNQALQVRSDFCASYFGLALLGAVSGRLELADAALERAATVPACAGPDRQRALLMVARFRAAVNRDWQRLVELASEDPSPEVGSCSRVLTHRAYLTLGRTADAVAVEEELARQLAERAKGGSGEPSPCALHMAGVRLLFANRPAEAATSFREADGAVTYRGAYPGTFKLFNLVQLADALRRAGETTQAEEVSERVRSINPSFARELLDALGL